MRLRVDIFLYRAESEYFRCNLYISCVFILKWKWGPRIEGPTNFSCLNVLIFTFYYFYMFTSLFVYILMCLDVSCIHVEIYVYMWK